MTFLNPELLQAVVKLSELKETKLSFWDALSALNIDDDVKSEFHDATLPWVNNNQESCINKAIKNKDYVLMSKLMLFKDLVIENINYSAKTFTMNEFKAALNNPIKVWRGGGGTFDPGHVTRRSWVPFTTRRERANTFSEYDGTYAMKTYELPKRLGGHWIAELECKIDDIFLYLPHGMDNEVILPKKFLKQAKVIKQT